MALSDDLKFKLIVAGVGVAVVLYAGYSAKKAVGGAISSVGDAVSNAWDTVTSSVGNAADAAASAVWDPFTQNGVVGQTIVDALGPPITFIGDLGSPLVYSQAQQLTSAVDTARTQPGGPTLSDYLYQSALMGGGG